MRSCLVRNLGDVMSGGKMEQRALSLLKTLETAGKVVSRVAVEGRRIEITLSNDEDADEFDRTDMRLGKA